MCPESWQDQYDLTQDSLPQSIRKLLGVLEKVKKVVANSNAKEKAKKESTENATGKRKKGWKGKHKGSSFMNYRIPKKIRFEKSCVMVGTYRQCEICIRCVCLRSTKLLPQICSNDPNS